MRTTLLLASLLLAVAACSDGSDPSFDAAEPDVEDVGTSSSELATDPNQFVFAVRRINATTFGINPVGNYNALCPDGVYRTECQVSSIQLGGTGLNATRQSQLMTRIAAEPASEASISLFFKGVLVSVRDRRTVPATSYFEFRAAAAYWAPSVRTHASTFSYVVTAPSGGYQTAKSVNTDFAPRGGGLDIAYAVQINWVGPLAERPTVYPADSFVAVAAYRPLAGGQFAFDVNQRFTRVTN